MLWRALQVGVLAGVMIPLTSARATGQRVDTAITFTNQDGVVRRFTIADMRALPQIEVKTDGNDGAVLVERGPSLRGLLTLGGAPSGQMLRGPSMLLVLVAEGSDGYKVAYTLAELDEQFGARERDHCIDGKWKAAGQTTTVRCGSYRSAPKSHRARWIRHLVALRLVRVELAPQPFSIVAPSRRARATPGRLRAAPA